MHPRSRLAFLVVLAALVIAPGCALGPKHQRPAVPVPESWREAGPPGTAIANLPWWDLYDDQLVQDLIREALRENKDVRIAAARVDEYRARAGFTRADQFPSFGYGFSASRGKESEDILPGGRTVNEFRGGLNMSYEADFWGKYRRSTEAARADLLATEEARRAVTISLVADVARVYLELRDFDGRRMIAERTLESRRESTDLVRLRAQGGIVADIDLRQAEIEEADAEARLSDIERQIVQKENELCFLLGRNPGPVQRGGLLGGLAPPEIPSGLPSELIERRPDILAAEAVLHAQTARVGVAIALRFPSFPITAEGGWASREFDDLDSGGTDFWGIAGALLGPLFEFGKNKRRVEAERARMEQARLDYERTVLGAFREVEDALIGVQKYRARRLSVERQVAAARDALRLSKIRYDGGVASYLEVLIQERTLFDAELLLSEVRRLELVSVVQLYKGLGGGWSPDDPTQVPPPGGTPPAGTPPRH